MKKILAILFLFLLPIEAHTIVRLPAIFSDHMVLQQDTIIQIWGWADKGERVEINLANQVKKVKVDKSGKWKIAFPAMKYGGPYTMEVKGKENVITIKDIYIGEVWLCSGQSNMEMKLNSFAKVYNFEEEVKNAQFPLIRTFEVKKNMSLKLETEFEGSWAVCSSETVANFSAVAYFYARKLYQELGVPVGIINSSWGGSEVETWISPDAFETLPSQYKIKYKDTEGKNFGTDHHPNEYPTVLYNGMINPLLQYLIKGVIWYQGENNTHESYKYRTLFPFFINNWRSKWGYDFPFYWVQLPGFHPKDILPEDSKWAELREAQTMTLSLPNTGQIVTTDIGDTYDVHPRNKQDVGLRLALLALNKTYGRKDIVYSCPVFNSMIIKGNKAVIQFDNVENGFYVNNKYGYIEGFAIAGADNKFEWAKAYIENGKVIVFSEKVSRPVSVRYCWSDNPDANLYNKEKFPAAPFRTDSLKGITEN